MVKKVIQVPVDEVLLDRLNQFSRKRNLTRSELIRLACSQYLTQVEREELDRCYRNGYAKFPEDIESGSVQISLVEIVLPKESW